MCVWERESRSCIRMYKYKHYYILGKCLCYSPGPTELLQRSGDLGLRRSSGKGKSLMLLASNNKSWSYFPPCLIKYFEKKTWLIDLPRPLIHYWFGTVKGPPQHYLLNGHKEPWNKWSTFTSFNKINFANRSYRSCSQRSRGFVTGGRSTSGGKSPHTAFCMSIDKCWFIKL